ncbi:MAG: hypothetical protein KGN36_00755 [Acidobacteriota bacterium]|nr:hypothetical protein [Acidobacteriota bacterium]
MPTGPRQLLEERCAQLSVDLETLFAESREQTRREVAELLNQAVRRLRMAPDPAELCATLGDAAACFATGVIVFRLEDGTARSPKIDVPLAGAPALAAASAMHDPLVALATAAEVSAPLAELAGHEDGERAHLFPLAAGDAVPAVIYAWGAVQGAAVELLAQAASAVWSAFPKPAPEPEPEPVPELVTIAAAPAAEPAAAAEAKPRSKWDDLAPAEQQTHLRAQRFARVQVAEMRLLHAEEVQSGRIRRDLYAALKDPIDTARAAFRSRFFTCPSMVDYLDLELTRTLAHDDPELLGRSYPGPLV